jgi:predicted RND superfamily exporter protein
VLLCEVTTIVGFASLAFTSHRGLASFGITLTLGITFALIFSLFVLPPLLVLAAPRLGLRPVRDAVAPSEAEAAA